MEQKTSMNFEKRMDRAKEGFARSMAQLEQALEELKRFQEKDTQQIRALAQRVQATLDSLKRSEVNATPCEAQGETNRPEPRLP
jgi:prefoldin subunit 5